MKGIMNNIVNSKKGHCIVNDSFAHKSDDTSIEINEQI